MTSNMEGCLATVILFLNVHKIGVDFALKVLNWDSSTTIRLQLWDIAGNIVIL